MEEDSNVSKENDEYNILLKNERQYIYLYEQWKAAIHYTVGLICKETEKSLSKNQTYSKEFIAALSQTAFNYLPSLARDLELFSKHAKRTTITQDDVILAARKSTSLSKHLRMLADNKLATREEGVKKKQQKRKLPVEENNLTINNNDVTE